MVTVRRWYTFLITAISLQAVTWAVIALLRNLLIHGRNAPVASISLQLAVIVVGLPLFLLHWLWAQRQAQKDETEHQSTLRWIYLYGMLAGFLAPLLTNGYDLLQKLIAAALGAGLQWAQLVPPLAAILVLVPLWLYHRSWILQETELQAVSGEEEADKQPAILAVRNPAVNTLRRVYLFGFCAAGVGFTTAAWARVVHWILRFPGGTADELIRSAAILLVCLPLWVFTWQRVQKLFYTGEDAERTSLLRKFYLYLAVFLSVALSVSGMTTLLAGLLRRSVELPAKGDWRLPVAVVIALGVQWLFHAAALEHDAHAAPEGPKQAGIRRLYFYLLAGIGLAAFLVGLGGVASVVIRTLRAAFFSNVWKVQFTWFTSALVAGLPIWIIAWRKMQLAAEKTDAQGSNERDSLVRRIYLYVFIFLATLTAFAGTVYILYRLISLAMGEPGRGFLLVDVAQAITFSLIALGVLIYHGLMLRGDRRLAQFDQGQRLSGQRMVLVETQDVQFTRLLGEQLQRELPGFTFDVISLVPSPGIIELSVADVAARLSQASLLVLPWQAIVALEGTDAEMARLFVAHPARKLLLPQSQAGWDWVGADPRARQELASQAANAIHQILTGEEVRPPKPLPALAVAALSLGGLVLAVILISLLANLFSNW